MRHICRSGGRGGTLRLFLIVDIFEWALFFWADGLPVRRVRMTKRKINDTISKLTLEEKINLLSGSTMMDSTGIPRLGIPAFRMSDGPMGAHIPPPSTAYAAALGWRRAGTASWRSRLGHRSAGTRGRAGRATCWGRA